jgi:hypothetical protein
MKSRFNKLVRWASKTEDIDVQLDTSYYKYAKTKKEDRIVNGMAGADGHITLYADWESPDWEFLTSMLIHEIGHVILFQEGKAWHSEKEAWICGIQIVPEEFRSKSIKEHIKYCLETYNYKRFDWLDNLL